MLHELLLYFFYFFQDIKYGIFHHYQMQIFTVQHYREAHWKVWLLVTFISFWNILAEDTLEKRKNNKGWWRVVFDSRGHTSFDVLRLSYQWGMCLFLCLTSYNQWDYSDVEVDIAVHVTEQIRKSSRKLYLDICISGAMFLKLDWNIYSHGQGAGEGIKLAKVRESVRKTERC